MDRNQSKNTYDAAFLEASTELNRIFDKFEQLSARRQQVESLVEALQPTIDEQSTLEWDPVVHMSKFEGLTVVTRTAVILKNAGD
ncbi:MAG TPA: hypothetical protein VMV57_12180 [Terracidiphilus sp.]|nr:hypothetical protein [Terracidiphilus sp.]